MLPKFRTKNGQRVRISEAKQRVLKLTGNNRLVRVFNPSGTTDSSMSPWMPLWSLFNDELTQRCEEGREPRLRAPYSRSRGDYKSSLENENTYPPSRHHATAKRHHSTMKTPAQLDRDIAETLVPHSAKGDRVLANLKSWGVDADLIAEVREAFRAGDHHRAMALARDLGWNRTAKRGRSGRSHATIKTFAAPKPAMTVRQINAIAQAADGRNIYLIRHRLGDETVQRITRARTKGRETEVRSLATGNWIPVLPERGDKLEVR